jgi:hypothetical protein
VGQTASLPSPRFPIPRRGLLLALGGDLLVLISIVWLGAGNEPGPVGQAPGPPQTLVSQDAPVVEPTPAFAGLEAEVRAVIEGGEAEVGVALLSSEGAPLLNVNADERFVLASVSKVYLLVAYLSQRYEKGVKLSDADMELLQPMIRVSDNASATAIWKKIGRDAGLARFLVSRGLAPVGQNEEKSWGTLLASPAQVAELLWRLTSGALLDPESTQVAMALLAGVHEEQSWGVSAGADDPAARIFLKNGWYPEADGWRVNSAGSVQGPEQGYVLVVFSYPEESLEEGIALVEDVARRINAFMDRR